MDYDLILQKIKNSDYQEAKTILINACSDARKNGMNMGKMPHLQTLSNPDDFVIFTKQQVQEIKEKLAATEANVIKVVEERDMLKTEKGWLTNEEFMEFMKISKRTAQKYRDTGMVAFSQIADKIYYKYSDIQELLNRHRFEAFKKPKKTIGFSQEV